MTKTATPFNAFEKLPKTDLMLREIDFIPNDEFFCLSASVAAKSASFNSNASSRVIVYWLLYAIQSSNDSNTRT